MSVVNVNYGTGAMPRLFVVGATGYIGRRILELGKGHFDIKCTSSRGEAGSLSLDLSRPDIFDYSNLRKGDVCIITAAISSPDICASKFDFAWSVNVTGTSRLIELLLEKGVCVIFFSSDTVYGERKLQFDEAVDCNPSGEYGIMKYEVENRFSGCDGFKSVRLSYVFSREDKFTKYLFECSRKGIEVDIFDPFDRAIVHRDDVVEAVLSLARDWGRVTSSNINFGGPEVLSRIDFALAIKRRWLPELRLKLVTPEAEFFKKRPRIISMVSPLIQVLLGRPARNVVEAMAVEEINFN